MGAARTPSSASAAPTATASGGSPRCSPDGEFDGGIDGDGIDYETRSVAYQRLVREVLDAQRATADRAARRAARSTTTSCGGSSASSTSRTRAWRSETRTGDSTPEVQTLFQPRASSARAGRIGKDARTWEGPAGRLVNGTGPRARRTGGEGNSQRELRVGIRLRPRVRRAPLLLQRAGLRPAGRAGRGEARLRRRRARAATSCTTCSSSRSTARSASPPPRSASTSTSTGPSSSAPPTAASCTGSAGSSSAAPGSTSGSRRASSTSSSTTTATPSATCSPIATRSRSSSRASPPGPRSRTAAS